MLAFFLADLGACLVTYKFMAVYILYFHIFYSKTRHLSSVKCKYMITYLKIIKASNFVNLDL